MTNLKSKKTKSAIEKIVFVLSIIVIWEYISKTGAFGEKTELFFPTVESIGGALLRIFIKGYGGKLFGRYIANSLLLLVKGMVIGIGAAFLFSGLSIVCECFCSIYELLITICDLIPGIVLLPVVIVVFGIKPGVIVFLVVHAVIWPMSRNVMDGFKAVPQLYVEVGLNMGLQGKDLLVGVYLPASISYIVSGIRVGWARAWRGLISAEMIFGVAERPGIGLFINQMRMNMKNSEMYATIIVIMIIGIFVQYFIFEPIEVNTVKKWGMTK